jgi:peptide/nickel transport system ATP-binding protein
VDGVSLELAAGKTLGLVGESGSGKSTLARAVVGLIEPTAGKVELLGFTLPAQLSRRDLATMRRLQMIFQEPDEALNPYRTIGATLARPLIRLLNVPRQELPSRVNQLLEAVRLPAAYADRLPGQLSGGEKQRGAIARAFAARPDLLIADEAVSALDVSVQASILNLLNDLQGQLNTAMIFISHDLAVVSYLADTIAVAYLGQIMQISHADQLVKPPYHPYTEVLLSCIPELPSLRRIDVPQPSLASQHVHLEVEIPTPIDKPKGCPFHTRCPRSLGNLCSTQQPPWQETMDGKQIFCHIPMDELREIQSPGGKE